LNTSQKIIYWYGLYVIFLLKGCIMHKKIFLCLAILISHRNISCINLKAPNTKAMLTTMAWGTCITAACTLLALISDKDTSAKEKIFLMTFSTTVAIALSSFMGYIISTEPILEEALMLKRARNTGIMCGLALPAVACLTYYDGKDPRNIRNILDTSTKLEKIF